jgi:hypothetical protein
MNDWLCVSAADSAHAPLLRDLIASFKSHPGSGAADWAVLDAGLDEATARSLAADGVKVLRPDWHVDPGIFSPPPPAHMRALQAIPFLPRAFPGYRLYMYIDADVWVQDWSAIELYVSGAGEQGFAVTPEDHESYPPVVRFHKRVLSRRFGWSIAARLGEHSAINSGAFCGRSDSPVWHAWQSMVNRTYAEVRAGRVNPYAVGSPRWCWEAVRRLFVHEPVEADFWLNQLALTRIIHLDRMPAALLPARCNWACHAALPALAADQRTLCEPLPPHHRLGLIHLTGNTKWQPSVELRLLTGGLRAGSLRYPGASGIEATV